MSSTLCFVIVGRNDCPLYDAELGTAPRRDEAAHLHQFILHGAMDIVQDAVWATNNMCVRWGGRGGGHAGGKGGVGWGGDGGQLVEGDDGGCGGGDEEEGKMWGTLLERTKLLLLHDSRNEDGIKNFFQEVHELYIKVLMNPLHVPGSKIISTVFDARVRALAKRHL
ncbi:unnamed protein product [Closterium sp. NIES-65]|nr:unnamed protein product [Closterium sp. NIES-65]